MDEIVVLSDDDDSSSDIDYSDSDVLSFISDNSSIIPPEGVLFDTGPSDTDTDMDAQNIFLESSDSEDFHTPNIPNNNLSRASNPQVPEGVPSRLQAVDNESAEPAVAGPSQTDDDADICSICFNSFTNAGAHRLVSLKCGHIFGQSCIERWIRSGKPKCPQCNSSAKKSDIRCIFATKIQSLDTAELERVTRDLEAEKKVSQSLKMDLAVLQQKYDLLKAEFDNFTSRSKSFLQNASISRLQSDFGLSQKTGLDIGELRLLGFIPCQANTCRNLAFSESRDTIVVTFGQQNNLFKGYGLKKLTTLDMRPTGDFFIMHKSEIRDVAFHDSEPLVLTVANDATAKLTSVGNNTVVHTYNLENSIPAWSCTWRHDNPANFYVGLRNGKTVEFDIRYTTRYVSIISGNGSTQPVVAMEDIPTPVEASSQRLSTGLAISQLSSCTYLERPQLPPANGSADAEIAFRTHPIGVEGNCISLSYWRSTRHLLATCRPSASRPHVAHYLFEMAVSPDCSEGADQANNRVEFRVQRQFAGGSSATLLSRSVLTADPNKNSTDLWACTPDEKTKSVQIWSASSADILHRLPSPDPGKFPILDLVPVRTSSSWHLAVLTQNGVGVYKFV